MASIFHWIVQFDPLSARLNTELGFVIDSEALAQRTEELFASRVPETSYRVHFTPDDHLYWTTVGPQPVRYDIVPETTFLQRVAVSFFPFFRSNGFVNGRNKMKLVNCLQGWSP
jgi:putative cardiolipin synthase